MDRRKKIGCAACFAALFLLMCGLFASAALSRYYARQQYEFAAGFAEWFLEEYPEDEQKIIEFIKGNKETKKVSEKSRLDTYGFDREAFGGTYRTAAVFSAACGAALLALLAGMGFFLIKKKTKSRIEAMTEYLAKANRGEDVTILSDTEDAFSVLEDEISKSVTELRTAKETAVRERKNFAESLENIAHQIKTPVTSLDLSVQMMRKNLDGGDAARLGKQIEKLGQLTDALLKVSRIDAGALRLKRGSVDVYTLLELSVEALESQIRSKKITVILPNHPEISFTGDLDWSVEVFINLIKNSIEHMEENGTLVFQYEENPLYVEIILTDDGEGFAEEEIPHLFERFYHGKGKKSGTGLGLSMAKSVIEMQNGIITAENLPDGGACFHIRFYSGIP